MVQGPPATFSQCPGLPGFTLPLNYRPAAEKEKAKRKNALDGLDFSHRCQRRLFPSALHVQDIVDGWSLQPLRTLREITMLTLMNRITDKKNWHLKVFKENIVNKWREDLQANTAVDISEPMLRWVVAELRFKAELFKETGCVIVFDSAVVKSDLAVPELTRLALKDAVQVLEGDHTVPVDYHPCSGDKVVDLVHPSLFPLVYGKTLILPPNEVIGLENCLAGAPSRGEILPVPREADAAAPPLDGTRHNYRLKRSPIAAIRNPYSRKFQWLPCDVEFDGQSECKIVSYINNLHPQRDAALYFAIEKIIACAVPLWNLTLRPLDKHNIRDEQSASTIPIRIKYSEVKWKTGEPPNGRYWTPEDAVQPEPGEFDLDELPWLDPYEVNLRWDYAATGLQVIVKLANIELTPEKPEYEGGSWHVEGHLNEHICATALYYYDSSNITESRLSFRQESAYDGPRYPPSWEHDWLESIYGCKNREPCVQELGDVLFRQGRLLTFPNILQHRVQPFRLADPSQPGHRKILALFLVDPNIRIISTANVPPQRRDWWDERDMAACSSDFPMSMEEAKKLRLELMEEKKVFDKYQDAAFHSMIFNLCEH